MKISKHPNYNFDKERYKKESVREFVCQFLDVTVVDAVMEMAYEMDMGVEDSTAYALAMFNAIQDVFYFHHNIKLGEISVSAVRNGIDNPTPVDDIKVIDTFRDKLTEPYLRSAKNNHVRVVKYLERQCGKTRRFEKGTAIQDNRNKAKERAKRKAESIRRNNKKASKIRKAKKKKWSYLREWG